MADTRKDKESPASTEPSAQDWVEGTGEGTKAGIGPSGPSNSDAVNKAQEDRASAQPTAGTHAKPELSNDDATPGAGTLTPAGTSDGTDSTSG